MAKLWLILFLALLASISSVFAQMSVDISLSKNDIVSEQIQLEINASETFDVITFLTSSEPLSVSYEGNHSIKEDKSNYVIELNKKIFPGLNIVNFTILYDDIVDKSGKDRIFRTSFYPKTRDTKIKVELPMYFVLSNKEPNVIPKPSRITTEGQKIVLEWEFDDKERIDISVFYSAQSDSSIYFWLFSIILILLFAFAYLFFRRTTKKMLEETLSSEEIKIINELRKGVSKQKDISKNLMFSKSKMSKLVRRLEEKGFIQSTPHFKTNLLKLKRKIK